MATSTIGSLTEFKPDSEKIEAYLERVQLFFAANGIEDDKKVPVLLTVIGSPTYALLSSLLAPEKPGDKSFTVLKDTLLRHFDPKPWSSLNDFTSIGVTKCRVRVSVNMSQN